jgi:steroid delta-isomerase-like uncharacterized protein
MPAEENKAAERRFIEEMWNQHNLGAMDEHVATEVVEHNPAGPSQGPGRESYRQSIAMLLSAFPDVQITIEDLIAEGDMVVERWTGKGTHRGEFMGIPPTNKRVMVEGIDIYRYAGGKRVETWRQWDRLGLLQQLGVVPPPGQGTP